MSKHRQSYRKGAYKAHGLIPRDGYSGQRDNARALLKVGTRSEWEGAESSDMMGGDLDRLQESIDAMIEATTTLLDGTQSTPNQL